MMDIITLIERWNSPEGHPYKGSLIDWAAYQAAPDNIGCMCAQGQVLHLVGGWEPEHIHEIGDQAKADKEVAKLLNISTAHAILLRNVNDSIDGAPAIVVTNPEKVIGDQAPTVLAFWWHLDRMTAEQWDTVSDVASDTVSDAKQWDTASDAFWYAASDAVSDALWDTVWDTVRDTVRDTARDAVSDAVSDAASYAVAEIIGARVLRERGKPFVFLPMFGFAEPEAVLDKQPRLTQEEI